MNRSLSLRTAGCAWVLMLATAGTWASDDHNRARDAVQAGQVLPLRTVLERIERDHPGQVLEVELEREDGHWIYEIKLLQSGGRLVKLEFDARSGALLQRRSNQRDREPRNPP